MPSHDSGEALSLRRTLCRHGGRYGEILIARLMDDTSVSPIRVTPALARALPFAAFIAFIALQSIAGERLAAWGLDPRWLYAIRVLFVASLLALFWRHYTELQTEFAGITVRRFTYAVLAGIAVFVAWINLDFAWARVGAPSAFDPTSPAGSGLAWEFVFSGCSAYGSSYSVMGRRAFSGGRSCCDIFGSNGRIFWHRIPPGSASARCLFAPPCLRSNTVCGWPDSSPASLTCWSTCWDVQCLAGCHQPCDD